MEDIFHLGIKALIRNNEGKILLLKTNVKSLRGYKGDPYWDIPGGRIQRGQTVEETLKREIEEETGITSLENYDKFDMILSNLRIPIENGDVGLILLVYLCDIRDLNSIHLSEEHIEYNWFSPLEAAVLLEVKYPREFTEKIKTL